MAKAAFEDRKNVSHQVLGTDGEFQAYFQFYNDLFQRNNGFHLNMDVSPAQLPITNDCIVRAIDVIKSSAPTRRKQVEAQLNQDLSISKNGGRALEMAIQAMLMIDPAAKSWHSADFTLGQYRPSSWLPDESLLQFVERLFPISLTGTQHAAQAAVQYRALRACKLEKHLGARFRLTNNLAEHLLFDEHRNCLYIFHHVAYLKAQLGRFEGRANALDINLIESLKEGTLPPQLLVETLYSIQAVLFPSIDPASARILDELVERRNFDPECTEYEGYKIFLDPPPNFQFVYWGERMAHLHTLMTRRPPRNRLEKWFHSHSTEGNALLIALLALAISILVGVVGIALNIVQIWITWRAWKDAAA